MDFDVEELDSSISQEQSAEYWRERAKCLEEWVCELLTKNQALPMRLQAKHAQPTEGYPQNKGVQAMSTGANCVVELREENSLPMTGHAVVIAGGGPTGRAGVGGG